MPNKVKIKGGPNLAWYIVTAVLFAIDVYYGLAWLASNIITAAAIYVYLRYKHIPIIKSLLDTDWYKLTMGQIVFRKFPKAVAKYHFINRGKTQFPEGFDKALRREIKALSKLRLHYKELAWLDKTNLSPAYVIYLSDFRFKPNQVVVTQVGGDLNIDIEGPWKETILWEVPLMAIISELYFRMTGKSYDEDLFTMNTDAKAMKMSEAGVSWSDFGTRRRFSAKTQDILNRVMLGFKGCIGTSNPYFAMKYGVKPIGTYAHEAVMAMQALHGATCSNRRWMEHWYESYGYNSNMLIALTDTLTTEVFFRDFDKEMAMKFSGVRQDSGDPFEFAEKMISHYEELGIDPKTKKIVFSDSLNADKAIALHEKFGSRIQCMMGIGTSLSNDCGHKPLNMVIKLTDVDFGAGIVPVVKLSDDEGKHTGNLEQIESVKTELGLLHSCVS